MQTRHVQRAGRTILEYERVCEKCGGVEWKSSSSARMCKSCALIFMKQTHSTVSRVELEEDEDKNQAMILEFEKNNKPSVTFLDEATKYKNLIDAQMQEIKDRIKKEETTLKEYQESKAKKNAEEDEKKQTEIIDSKKNGSEMSIEWLKLHIRYYERQFDCKKEALKHFTKEIRKEFERLGYKKKETELIVDLTGFNNVDDYYDYHEAIKIQKGLAA